MITEADVQVVDRSTNGVTKMALVFYASELTGLLFSWGMNYLNLGRDMLHVLQRHYTDFSGY